MAPDRRAGEHAGTRPDAGTGPEAGAGTRLDAGADAGPQLLAVLVAAGASRRMGRDKLWIEIAGRPVWRWSLDALLATRELRRVAIVTAPGSEDAFTAGLHDGSRCVVVPGGAVRADSVLAGLDALARAGARDDALVLVHDAARPAVSSALVERVVEAAATAPGVVPAIAVHDSLWRTEPGDGDRSALDVSVERAGLVASQTPQAGRLGTLRAALASARAQGVDPGDEAAALRAAGVPVVAVRGDAENVKVTEPGQERLLEAVLRTRAAPLAGRVDAGSGRAGIGFDAHRLVPGRALRLGGVGFPGEPRGLAGHSDGDVALHAVIDALLGAARLGDIGTQFPATPEWEGADSGEMLAATRARLRTAGWVVSYVDLTIVATRPAIGARSDEIAGRIGALLGVPAGGVSVKATTTDGLGFPADEGIAAYASAVVVPVSAAE